MHSKKRIYYSLVSEELSHHVSIAWYKFCSIVYKYISENVSIV